MQADVAEWYFLQNGQQIGPLTLAVLRQFGAAGQLKPDDYVWKAGMADWAEARTVRELNGSLAAPAPRRAPATAPATPAVRTPHFTVYDGVVFCEKKLPDSENLEEVEVKLSGIGAQLKSLDDVKAALAEQVREAGGNCLNFFEYGQKSTYWSFDSVAWFGKGVAGALPDDLYRQLIQRRRG